MYRKYSTVLIVATIVLSAALPFKNARAEYGHDWYWKCDTQRVTSFWEEQIAGNKISGRGTLCKTPRGTWSTMRLRGLTSGNAYTVWWVYIDDPDSCVNAPLSTDPASPTYNPDIPADEPVGYAGRCGLADFFTMDPSGEFLNPLAVYGRMDSVIADSRRKIRFAGDIRNFTPSPGSQIWMFVFGHGPADTTDNRQLARQLLTPEDPLSGVPHLGISGRPFGYPAGVVVFDVR